MMVGVGIDLVDVERIRRALENPRFVLRILTERERASLPLTAERVAGRWAAKEAVAKAVGRPLRWHDVEILGEPDGAPRAVTRPGVLAPGCTILLSITHERETAAAVALLVAPCRCQQQSMV
ncbi:MAG: 4'-phosphopantetheinyl transferase superfamily protein [Fimbriimonadales bacterium]